MCKWVCQSDQLDGPARRTSWTDQLDRPAGRTSSLYLKPWPVRIFKDFPFSLYNVAASESDEGLVLNKLAYIIFKWLFNKDSFLLHSGLKLCNCLVLDYKSFITVQIAFCLLFWLPQKRSSSSSGHFHPRQETEICIVLLFCHRKGYVTFTSGLGILSFIRQSTAMSCILSCQLVSFATFRGATVER